MFAAFAATLLFALSAVSGSRCARLLGGTRANFARLLLAALFLGIWAHSWGGGVQGAAFPVFFISGCVGFGVGDLALFQAYPRLGARLTMLFVQCLAAPLAALVEWIWLGTTLSLPQISCGVLILGGVAIALLPERDGPPASRKMLAGSIFGLIAAFGQGLGAVISRKAFAMADMEGINVDGATAAYQRILGGLVVGALGLAFLYRGALRAKGFAGLSEADNSRSAGWRVVMPWLLLNSLAGPAIGVSFYQWALKIAPTGIVMPIVATTPLAVIPFAYLIEGDRPRLLSLAGGLVAVAGAVALTLVS